MVGRLQLGEIEIGRILEQEGPFRPAKDLVLGLTDAVLDENRAWMQAMGALDANDTLMLAIQSFLIRTPHHTILIDTCVGNDKTRPQVPAWNQRRDTGFMDNLAAAGVGVGQIDYVLCTHLHVDHVGWNTKLEDGRWVPTFPKARYVFGRREYDHWHAVNAKAEVPLFMDSVLPIVEHGRAEMVADDHAIGDHLRLMPTPGHTPGHLSVVLGRRDDAVVSGDLSHTPLQTRYPELSLVFDADPAAAAVTRRAFFDRFADTETVCCMTHYPSPSLFRMKRAGDGFRFEAV